MMRSTSRCFVAVLSVWVVLTATMASAQVIGTFRWQFAPYCNVVTLRVEQKGNVYELAGTDDQCGGGILAAANGSAHLNPNGTIGLALTIVRPDGLTLTSSATLNPASISGAWSDEYANHGTMVFNPGPTSGAPRRITLTGVYTIAFQPTVGGEFMRTHISFGRTLPAPPQASTSNIIPVGGPGTNNCPGSLAAPQALPGQVCLYDSFRDNVTSLHMLATSGVADAANDNGVLLYLSAVSTQGVRWEGKWAVTIP